MLYRKSNYTEAKDYKPYAQSFSSFKKDYRLDERNNELVETGTETNIQAQIQSALESTFDKLIQKYLPTQQEEDPAVKTLARMQDRLDLMSQAFDTAEEYREQYQLSDDLSATEIFKLINDKSEQLKTYIKEQQAKQFQDQNAKLLEENAKLKKQLEGIK